MSDELQSQGQSGAGAPPPTGRAGAHREVHHWRRLIPSWVIASIVGDLIWFFLVGSHVPPGDMTSSAAGAQFDMNVLMLVCIPVAFAVWIYGFYACVVWRASKNKEIYRASAARTNLKIQAIWISTVTLTVVGAFAFGTYELVVPAGAGGGEGPNPIWTPTSKHILPIQVIGQQWKWTYRYPTFGGMETNTLVVPNHTTIAFHVTSLDVIHDFWAYQLGIKADANPQVDDVAFTTTHALGTFTVRCDELCGLWHGAMFNYGKVVSKANFESWAESNERASAANTKFLPPFAWTYSATANGATGVTGVNTSGQAPFSAQQTYGATPAKKTVTSPITVTPNATHAFTIAPGA